METRREILRIYGREGCHLCEEMVKAVRAIQVEHDFALEWVDVDENEELERLYGSLIPVLIGSKGEICHYFFDQAVVDAYLAKIR